MANEPIIWDGGSKTIANGVSNCVKYHRWNHIVIFLHNYINIYL